jgi:putative tryptophan/tyrosine transport system substrate-binding protein
VRRREVIGLLGGAAAWPIAARAQQSAIPTVGCLFSGTPEGTVELVAALRRGMGETGFVENRNVAVEYRWSYNDPAKTVENATDLVKRHVQVIAASTAAGGLAAKAATATIPIVFVAFADAIQVGLVTNLARPGANVTGINSMSAEFGAKRIGLLHELLPRAQRLGLLADPSVPWFKSHVASAEAAAKSVGAALELLIATTAGEIDAAFAHAIEHQIEALTIANSQRFFDRRVQLTTRTIRHGLPTVFFDRSFAQVGGMMSYGSSTTELFRQAGIYVGRILEGQNLGDLPVMQPTKFELVINMQTAKLLGIDVPPTLLALADEVIE